jgi:hypothetical protein
VAARARLLPLFPNFFDSRKLNRMPSAVILLADGTEEMELYASFLSHKPGLIANLQHDHLRHACARRSRVLLCLRSCCKCLRRAAVCHRIAWDTHHVRCGLWRREAVPPGGCSIIDETKHDRSYVVRKSSYDALVIPGGATGAETMSTNPTVQNLVRDFLAQDKIVGMICAGGCLPHLAFSFLSLIRVEMQAARPL